MTLSWFVTEIVRDSGANNIKNVRHKSSTENYFSSRSNNAVAKEKSGRKTPFEIFLEDDGPYSRKLYGPVERDSSSAPSKVTTSAVRNLSSSKSTEFLDKSCGEEFVERDIRSISAIKKGLLWQQRDKLFSRSDSNLLFKLI